MEVDWLEADRAALGGWLELHHVARRLPHTEDSRALAEAALHHIVPLAGELPEDPPFVGAHAPTKPAATAIEPWIRAVEESAGQAASGTLLKAGVELGLLGVDEDVDRRAARVIVDGYELDTIQQALEEIGRQALLDRLVGRVAFGLADSTEAHPGRRPLLRALCRRSDAALLALREHATAHPSLAVMSVYLWAVVDRHPDRRAASARTLLMVDPHAVGDVRALWGENGPTTKEEQAELLRAFHDAERRPPELDVRRALATLMAAPLDEVDPGDSLALALRALPDHATMPAYCAWYAAARRPGETHDLDAWARTAALALESDEVPRERHAELLAIAARELIDPRAVDGYFEALDRLRTAAGPDRLDPALTAALTRALDAHDDPLELLAVTFSIWAKAPTGATELHDRVLAPAARPYRRDDDGVRAHLGPRRQAEWDAFVERHPRPRFGRRLFARRRARAR